MTAASGQNPPDTPLPPPGRFSLFRRIWRRIENGVFLFFFLLIVLYFVLQSPFVQNWLVGKATAFLSEELQTTVRLDRIDVGLFDNVILEGLYVEDRNQDTLLFARELRASLETNFFSILNNRLNFDEITLSSVQLRLKRPAGQAENNLQFILDYFAKPRAAGKPPAPFHLRIKNLWLFNIVFSNQDEVSGQKMRFTLPKGNIRIHSFDVGKNTAELESVAIEGLRFELAAFEGKPLPKSAVPAPRAQKISTATDPAQTPARPMTFSIRRFNLDKGAFKLDQYRRTPARTTAPEVMDFNHLFVQDIAIQAANVYFTDGLYFQGILKHLSAKEQSGFTLRHAEAAEVVVCDTLTALYKVKIQTDGSNLGDTIALRYRSYKDFLRFNDRVTMEAAFAEGAALRIGDLIHFSNPLARNAFFTTNREEIAQIQGRIFGKVNRLNGRDLNIQLGERTVMRGAFDGDDMGEGADRLRLSFNFEQLESDFQTIRSIIPGFSVPDYFYRLGRINFIGRYQLLFGFNHILDGQIRTNVGNGDVDLELDLTNGMEKATYSGRLDMNSFDLAAWTGNADFGAATFHLNIAEGSTGLTLPTIRASVNGAVDTLSYKGYTYRNLRMNGAFQQYIFEGKVGIEDPNVNFRFDGTVNLKDTVPVYDFTADITRINLQALNLTKQDWTVSGNIPKIQLRMRSLNDLEGKAELQNFLLVQDDSIRHQIKSLVFRSNLTASGERQFVLESDLADAIARGRFNPLELSRRLQSLWCKYHPKLGAQLGFAPGDTASVSDDLLDFTMQIKNSQALTQLFAPELDTLRDISLIGRVEAAKGLITLSLNAPRVKYGNVLLERIDLNWNNMAARFNFDLNLPRIQIGKRSPLEPIQLSGNGFQDDLNFSLRTLGGDTTGYVRALNLNGVLDVVDTLWQLRFKPSNLSLFNERWYIEADNYARFTSSYFETKNFEIGNEANQRIRLDSLNGGRGLALGLTNFDLRFLNKIFPSRDTAMYRGKIFDFEVYVQDVFKQRDLSVFITTDTLFVRNKPYGAITGNLELRDLRGPFTGKIFLNDAQRQLRLSAAYLPESAAALEHPEFGTLKGGEFKSHVTAANFPMDILEQFIPGISKTGGALDADVTLSGPFDKVEMDGKAFIREGQFQIDYLKSMFYIRNQPLHLSSTQIWADGDTIWDATVNQNYAIVQGGLRHAYFKNWSIDCRIESAGNNFMALNTQKGDNALFYGQGIGKFKAEFSGTFTQTDIRIDAVTGDNTRLYIPLSEDSEIKDIEFITYRNKNDNGLPEDRKAKRFRISELKGLNLELNISVTDAAEVQIIFDEQAGDIVKGRGVGDLSLSINREGEFKMYGNYTIRRGEYLFTLLNFVNKPFTVADGGTISWNGSPFDAQIRLDATYDENTPIFNFISDELQLTNDQTLSGEARKATRVLVTMHLSGDLFKPDISFEMDFPNLTNRLKTLSDNKLRLLRQDPNELNRQVFGLVVVGSFLPSNLTGSSYGTSFLGQAQASGINTLTQVFTSQLSNYLSGLAAEWFGGTVSSIDFDIAYNEYRNALADPSQPNLAQTGRELQVRLTSGFADDRVTVQFGSQFGLGRPATSANQDGFLGEDVTVEIQMTKNRQWRLKVYQRMEPDIAGGPRRLRYGFGLSFRQEYDSFDELMRGLTKWMRKAG